MEVLAISKNKELQINEDIRDKEVRLVGEDGEQLGVVPVADALRLASEKNLDLVKIAPQASPPVCKIMDYGKHLFEQSKRDKEAKKKQKIIVVKEVRLSVKIEDHDFNTKLKNAIKFLSNGDKVKVSIRFRGREMAHPQIAQALMERFNQACSEYGEQVSRPKMEGRSMSMMLNPIDDK